MKKLNCKKIEEKLPFYLERELSEEEAKQVEEHLLACDKCLASLEEWKKCFSLLGNVPRVEAPPYLWERIRANLLRRERRRVPLPIRWLWVYSLALFLVVVGLTIFRQLSQPRSAPLVIAQQPPAPSLSSSPPQLPTSKVTKPTPLLRKSTPPTLRGRISTPTRVVVSRMASGHPPSLAVPEGSDVEEKVVERLEMALLSAQSAEESLTRALEAIQGKSEF